VDDNLSLMSAGFLLPSLDAAVIWRGPKKNGLIKQLLRDVDWTQSGGFRLKKNIFVSANTLTHFLTINHTNIHIM
jgi:hypothetical protein